MIVKRYLDTRRSILYSRLSTEAAGINENLSNQRIQFEFVLVLSFYVLSSLHLEH